MSKRAYDQIDHLQKPKLIETQNKLKGADGKPIKLYGKMNVPIIFGKDQIHQQILVCDIVSDGILEQDFLLSHATAIDFKNSLINTKSFQIKRGIGGEANASCRVLTTERKHIPGSSKASVNVKIENPNSLSCLALVTKNTDLSEPNVLVIEGIITTTSDIFTTHKANTGE
ncbi:hypothetical protein DPMN_160306 [Dreissena polymorpha]|uniref:Uncharacterized protein n=1 Tax=Dreissena polymorpha TaxID=45954 RepID=A0A9D4INM7_DREPO|nr:hypothetical protein DPMN_160306 [Dreissena polymorpha]